MRPRWLAVLLALSLAGNLVELGFFGYWSWKRRHDMQAFFERLATGTAYSSLHVLDSACEAASESLRFERLRLERDLLLVRLAGPPDSSRLAPFADSMALVARAQHRLLFDSRRAVAALPDSGPRRRLEQRWRLMTGIASNAEHDRGPGCRQ